nr:DUF4329 domain-containing protein [Chryseobacterium lacus]
MPYKSYNEAAKNFGDQYNGMSIRMNGEIGTQFYKVSTPTENYYSYTLPKSGGPGSWFIEPRDSGPIPDEGVKVGEGHTHGSAGYQIPVGNGKFHDDNNMPSESHDILRAKENSKNPNYEGDVVITSGGYMFIYGPGTQNDGKRSREMTPVRTDLPKDPQSKTNPSNTVTPNNSPLVLPIDESDDKYPLK